MKKLGIFGGKGMLGCELCGISRSEGFEPIVYDLPDFDIRDEKNLDYAFDDADIFVNCAAYTNVDRAEEELEKAMDINAFAVEKMGKAASSRGKYLLHISTDFVFGDNSERKLTETDKVNPLGIYGKSKLRGEKLLQDTDAYHSIVRIQWTYGKHGNNFISKILALSKKMQSLKVVSDQIGSPTWTADAARAIISLLKNKAEGLFHFASDGYASRYETAKFAFKTLGIDTEVFPCSSSAFETAADRPLNSRFDCSKIDKVLDFKRPNWQDSLKNFLNL